MTVETREQAAPGGSFMTGPVEAVSVFTPEQLSDEHRAIREAVTAFVDRQVAPRRGRAGALVHR